MKILRIAIPFLVFINACTGKKDPAENATYYVEFLNCSDSLHKRLDEGVNGKVSFYKNNKLNLLSLNYLTEKYPDMHYYKSMKELPAVIPEGTRKVLVEFSGNFTIDSTYYSIRRFSYTNNAWKKVSDIGTIRAESLMRGVRREDPFSYRELVNIVTENAAGSTY